MGRKCAVPHCYTGYRKCPDKAALYKVPDDDFFLSKWQEAIARDDRPITPKDYVCDKHFKDDDILRKRIRKDVVEEYRRPRLKPDAIPSIFPDLPEFILKMTKKRRKLNVSVPSNSHIQIGNINKEEVDEQLEIKDEPEYDKEENTETEINLDEINIKSEYEDIALPIEETEEYDCNGAKLYCCDVCSYKTKFSHNLRTHKIKHLSGENAYMTCELCVNYKTKWEITYVNHMKSKHGIVLKDILKCPFCVFKTKNKNFLARHCEYEHKSGEIVDKKFKCEFDGCSYETESNALLDIHSFTHDKLQAVERHNIRTFSCKECNFLSNCKGSLATHVKIVHVIGNVEKAASISNNSEKWQENKIFSCIECYFETSCKTALTKHINSAHNTGEVEKTKKTTSTVKLTLQDIKKKQIQTKIISSDEHDSLSHTIKKNPLLRSLMKEKIALKCSRCPYKSHSEDLLKKHLRKHQMVQTSNPQKFSKVLLHCMKCSFTTFSESSLENHQKDTFHCDECPFMTKDKAEYLKHTLIHRNTSVKPVVRNASQETSSSGCSNGTEKNINTGQDFSMVTIKEEHDDSLSFEDL